MNSTFNFSTDVPTRPSSGYGTTLTNLTRPSTAQIMSKSYSLKNQHKNNSELLKFDININDDVLVLDDTDANDSLMEIKEHQWHVQTNNNKTNNDNFDFKD